MLRPSIEQGVDRSSVIDPKRPLVLLLDVPLVSALRVKQQLRLLQMPTQDIQGAMARDQSDASLHKNCRRWHAELIDAISKERSHLAPQGFIKAGPAASRIRSI